MTQNPAKRLEMNILFSNMSNLLGKDLTEYSLHFIEKELVGNFLNFLKDVKENSYALSGDRAKFNFNTFSFNSIPDFAKAYDLYKEELENISLEGLSENFNNFLGLLEKKISKFYNTNEIDKKSQGVLIKFFEKLNEKYEENI